MTGPAVMKGLFCLPVSIPKATQVINLSSSTMNGELIGRGIPSRVCSSESTSLGSLGSSKILEQAYPSALDQANRRSCSRGCNLSIRVPVEEQCGAQSKIEALRDASEGSIGIRRRISA